MNILRDQVLTSRTGPNGAMKLTCALEVIQDCTLLWSESESIFRDFLAANNMGMFLASKQADVQRLPVYGERITVKTGFYDYTNFYGYRNTVLYGEDGTPCVLTWCMGAFVNINTGRLARVPQSELNRLTIEDKIEMDYQNKKIILPDLPGKHLDPVAVRRNDIDMNYHMNNIKYIENAVELLPENFVINRVRVEYKVSAKLGDLLYPKVIEAPSGNQYILFLNSQDNPFTIMEFS